MITDQIMCANGVRARATLTDAKMWCSAGAGGAKVRSTYVRGREESGARSSYAVPRIPYRADVSRGGSISAHTSQLLAVLLEAVIQKSSRNFLNVKKSQSIFEA